MDECVQAVPGHLGWKQAESGHVRRIGLLEKAAPYPHCKATERREIEREGEVEWGGDTHTLSVDRRICVACPRHDPSNLRVNFAQKRREKGTRARSGRGVAPEHRGHTRKERLPPQPVSRSFHRSTGVARTSRYAPLFWTKKTPSTCYPNQPGVKDPAAR